jgi:hypothetical protein
MPKKRRQSQIRPSGNRNASIEALEDRVVLSTLSVSGTIELGISGQRVAIPSIKVIATTANTETIVGTAYTDADGKYSLTVPDSPIDIYLVAEHKPTGFSVV